MLRLPSPTLSPAGRTPQEERAIAPHPSLKPQKFLRQLVWAALPFGKGKILDPFAGSGSTLAAAEAVGHESVGIEVDEEYYNLASEVVPQLARIPNESECVGDRQLA